jgi:tetratricopeptide (TPR) repeat protein
MRKAIAEFWSGTSARRRTCVAVVALLAAFLLLWSGERLLRSGPPRDPNSTADGDSPERTGPNRSWSPIAWMGTAIKSRLYTESDHYAELEQPLREAIAQARGVLWPKGFDDQEFAKAWHAVDHQTRKVESYLREKIRVEVETGRGDRAIPHVERLQRIRHERAGALQAARAFPEALKEVAAARKLYEEHRKAAEEIITVSTMSGARIVKTERMPRGNDLKNPEELDEFEINILRQWKLEAAGDPQPRERLLSAYERALDTHPHSGRAFEYCYSSMELRDNLDVDRLQEVLRGVADKETEQHVSNCISLANTCLRFGRTEQAKALYEEALGSAHCPQGRLAEVYLQLGDIQQQRGELETALRYYKRCQAIPNRFRSVPGQIERLEKQLAEKRVESAM